MFNFESGYYVSTAGEIFSDKGRFGLREIKGKVAKSGYREVLLTVCGKRIYKHVHRVVAESFLDNPKNLRTVNHKNGNKLDNRLENLEWMSDSENLCHARDLGLLKCKINSEIAEKIRLDNRSHRLIAKDYGIGKTQVGYIKNGKRWKK